jgi:SRSO17 transposase
MIPLEPIDTAPTLDLAPQEVATLIDALRVSHAIYSPLFQRRAQRDCAEKYLHGLLLELPRKSIEPMIVALEGADQNAVRAMQQFLSAGAWDDARLLRRHWQEVDGALGDTDGVLRLDGSDFAKQGTQSVGVTRQYGGELGKRANCQAGVVLGYASRHGYPWLDRRLYLPQAWLEDEAYAARRAACGVPEAGLFTTTPMLGWALIQAVHQAGSLPCRWVACAEAFGRETTLLDQIAGLGWWYYAAVPQDTRVWLERPATAVPAWSGRGRTPTRARVVAGTVEPPVVAALAAALPARAWSQQTIKAGRKGPLVAAFATLRVLGVREGLPGPAGWLILRRNEQTGALKTSLRNAPPDTPRTTLVRMSGMRWPSAICCEDGKQYLGLGD